MGCYVLEELLRMAARRGGMTPVSLTEAGVLRSLPGRLCDRRFWRHTVTEFKNGSLGRAFPFYGCCCFIGSHSLSLRYSSSTPRCFKTTEAWEIWFYAKWDLEMYRQISDNGQSHKSTNKMLSSLTLHTTLRQLYFSTNIWIKGTKET